MPDKTKKLTLMQIAMLKAYNNGEYSYLAESETEKEALDSIGDIDRLGHLVLSELGRGSEVESLEDGVRRLESIMEDVRMARDAVSLLDDDEVLADLQANSNTPSTPRV